MFRSILIWASVALICCAATACSKKNNTNTTVSPEVIAAGSDLAKIIGRGKMIVGMDVSDIRYQPFEMKNKNGEIVGFDVDLAQIMADELGVNLEIVPTNWDGIIPALIDGKFDLIISAMAVSTERNKAVNFSAPYYLSGKCLLINSRDVFRINDYHDLNHKDTVVVTTFSDDMVLNRYFPEADIVRFKNDEEAVREVIERRARAFIADRARISIFAVKYPGTTIAIKDPFTYEPIAVGMRKGDVDLLNWVNNCIEIIKGDGRLAELEKKWMEQYIPPSSK
ncbi:MAG: transporter substrate-binding domain-containing protein [Deltaproteobacteria bacterium]|nr:transporter substrate-binding domain-containing protein [Candidatus Zymogenaceae bacterium]